MRPGLGPMLLLSIAAVTSPTSPWAYAGEPDPPPLLTEDEWHVRVEPSHHPGPYRLKVAIDPDVPWPTLDGAAVSYLVEVRSPDGDRRKVGWLTEKRRAISTPIPLGAQAALLGLDREAAKTALRKRNERFQRAFEAIAEATPETPPSPEVLAIVDDRISLLLPREIAHPPAILWKYAILLTPHAAGQPLRQEMGPRPAAEPRYSWGTEVTDAADPCVGQAPEDCVRERLDAIRERLCNSLRPDGSPRYFFECIVLAFGLSSEPPRVEVACHLDGATANTAPTEGPLQRIEVNGEYFLTGDCLEGTILHELTHVFDLAQGRLSAALRLRRAAQRIAEARKRLGELLEDPRNDPEYLDALEAAMDELSAARAAFEELASELPEAGVERLQSECRALFAELESWDFLGPPDETLPWVVDSIQASIEQQMLLPGRLGVPETAETDRARCDCFRRIRDWVEQNPAIEEALDNETCPYGDGSWLEFLEELIDLSCP